MPNDAFRLRVMKAVSAQLKTITPANGYNFDLSDYEDEQGRTAERVFRGRDIFGPTDPTPMLCVLEDPRTEESEEGSDGRVAQNVFRVLIQGFIRGSEDHPLDATYGLSADIITALREGKYPTGADAALGILKLGRGCPSIKSMVIGQPVHRPGGDEISGPAYMLIGIKFLLIENLERPYD